MGCDTAVGASTPAVETVIAAVRDDVLGPASERQTVSRAWTLRIASSAAVAFVAVVTGAPVLVRGPIVFWFLLVCPGMAVVAHVGAARTPTRWTLAIAVSLAVDIVVAEVFLYAHLWRPTLVLVALGVIATATIMTAPLAPRAHHLPSVSPAQAGDDTAHRSTRPFYVSEVAVALAAHESAPIDAQPAVKVGPDATSAGDPAA